MNSHRPLNIRRSRRRPTFLIVGILVLFLLLLSSDRFSGFLRSVAVSIGGPVWSTSSTVSGVAGAPFSIFRDKQKLIDENKTLKAEIEKLRTKDLSYHVLERENAELWRLLGQLEDGDLSVAGVVMPSSGVTPYDTLLISIGKEEGATLGEVVYSDNGVALGNITDISDKYSWVELYSSADRVSALRLDDRLLVDVTGVGNQAFRASLPRDFAIEEGMLMLLPGESITPVAIVYQVLLDPNDPFMTVYARSLVNIHELKHVYLKDLN